MSGIQLEAGEKVRVDLTSPLTSLTFPFLELILITGLCWMGIGYLDRPDLATTIPTDLRNAVVVIWLLLVTWRFILPLARSRRRRFMVTDRRVLVRAGTFKARTDSIPLRQIHHVDRRRNRIALALGGFDRPLHFKDVPKAKKAAAVINQSIGPARYS
ncbi:Bacterial membrane flanked domain protein [Corynebacterium occultum]|uniref:Bacterial membrane flanked domain protein n=1 Tax=Corynebacterium occultum TaxID=2675219 RepID=A0A6B8W5H2_9CORY|nr:PH domain-containing protein [Corynebacterium occultum]QGU06575.1 Bacterial membrane flanked domain protein [Corynebacterium occultum]